LQLQQQQQQQQQERKRQQQQLRRTTQALAAMSAWLNGNNISMQCFLC
jgi:hypothetical protein